MKKLTIITDTNCKRGFLLTFVFVCGIIFSGCTKQSTTAVASSNASSNASNSSTSSGAISNADMREAVSDAVTGSTSGLATQSATMAELSTASSLACGQTKDTTISGSSPSGFIFTYNYNLGFKRTSICTNGVVTQYNTSITGSSSYSGLLMSSNDSTSAQMSVSGVQASSANYVLNGTYLRTGTLQSFLSSQSFNGTLTFASDNITIAKTNNQILSGSANVQFTGTNFSGTAFNRTASITFLGNNQATLVLDNGSSSTISW